MKFNIKRIIFILVSLSALFLNVSCSKKSEGTKNIAVFVPGILADSPIYSMMASGVEDAVKSFNSKKNTEEQVQLTIMEAGTNQAEWSAKLISLAAEQKYSVIISSNPSLPELVEPITAQFPNQKFILLDAHKEGNKNVYTARYNQHEQAYLTGCMAALVSKTGKLGLISAQEYPVMNNVILPGFEEGARSVNPSATVDFRLVGNWYDASKGAELTTAMSKIGVDVILPICGGASQGVISSAKENNIFLTFFDSNVFERAPENIVSCTVLEQKTMARQVTEDYLQEKIEWGVAKTVGVKEGYVRFVQDADNHKNANVSDAMRQRMQEIVKSIEDGKLHLPQD